MILFGRVQGSGFRVRESKSPGRWSEIDGTMFERGTRKMQAFRENIVPRVLPAASRNRT
jgi:hypothetical protein